LEERQEEETIEDQQEWAEHLLWDANKGRICDYCGINMDIPWLDILKFFHEDCWKQYRKDGKLDPCQNMLRGRWLWICMCIFNAPNDPRPSQN
jgi:hypothetical protein